MPTLTIDQIGGIIRVVVGIAVTMAVAHGVDGATAQWIGAGIVGAVLAVWSAYTNRAIKTTTTSGATMAATPIADARKAASNQ